MEKWKRRTCYIDFQFDFGDLRATRWEFPVRLIIAETVHNSQGKPLKLVLVDARSPLFSLGQFFVALSRFRNNYDVTLVQMEADTPDGVPVIYPMPVECMNPILRQAVELCKTFVKE